MYSFVVLGVMFIDKPISTPYPQNTLHARETPSTVVPAYRRRFSRRFLIFGVNMTARREITLPLPVPLTRFFLNSRISRRPLLLFFIFRYYRRRRCCCEKTSLIYVYGSPNSTRRVPFHSLLNQQPTLQPPPPPATWPFSPFLDRNNVTRLLIFRYYYTHARTHAHFCLCCLLRLFLFFTSDFFPSPFDIVRLPPALPSVCRSNRRFSCSQ